MDNLHVIDNPLVSDTLTRMRRASTDSGEFRSCMHRLSALLVYEASHDLPVHDELVRTPVKEAMLPVLDDLPLTVVPILRAGMGMLDGVLSMIPQASVGVIGMERDEDTFVPQEYYCKLPRDVEASRVYVIDPMLATGGSACDAIASLKSHGCADLRFVCIVAAPEGVRALGEAHPDVPVYTAALDEGLNERAYIVPGLGDAGDRVFGTE